MALFKRKQRDGSLSETFHANFQYRGKRVVRNTFATTKKDGERWIKERKAEIDLEGSQRSLKKNERLTLEMAGLRYWTEHLRHLPGGKSEKYRLQQIIEEIGPGMMLEDLTTADMKALVARRQASGGVTGKTANRDLHPIKALHNMARDVWEYPVKGIAWKKVKAKERKRALTIPTRDDLKALVTNVPMPVRGRSTGIPRLAHVIMFAAITGLRRTEIKKVQWTHLRQNSEGMPLLWVRGKGEKEEVLPLSSAAISLISSIPRTTSPFVFDLGSFNREWGATRDRAGLRHIRFHDLRHFFATTLRKAMRETHGAVDPLMLKDAMRHSDLATSYQYVHADNQELLPSLDLQAGKLTDLLSLLPTSLPENEQTPDDPSTDGSEEGSGPPSASSDQSEPQ